MIDAVGTVIATCPCHNCTVTLADEWGLTKETVPTGRVTTSPFENVGVVDVDGDCDPDDIGIHIVEVVRAHRVPRWDRGET